MSLEDFLDISSTKKKTAPREATEKQEEPQFKPSSLRREGEEVKKYSSKEEEELRKDPLYKGRLTYLEEVILKEQATISSNLLAEKLDIPLKLAKVLLTDYKEKKNNGHSKE